MRPHPYPLSEKEAKILSERLRDLAKDYKGSFLEKQDLVLKDEPSLS